MDVLNREATELERRRMMAFPGGERRLRSPDETARVQSSDQRFSALHQLRPFGLSLSGGGIRSATFSLGVLQGLAERNLLPYIDYLSTVSGGGYAGAWLHGVIHNQHHGQPAGALETLTPTREPGDAWRDPITFLRKYSNYLAPVRGLFAPDTWTIAAVWLRNMVLNLLILIPFFAGLVLTAILFGRGHFWLLQNGHSGVGQFWPVPLLIAIAIVSVDLRHAVGADRARHRLRLPDSWRARYSKLGARFTGKFFAAAAVIMVTIAAYLRGGVGQADWRSPFLVAEAVGVFLLFVLLQVVGGFGACYRARNKGNAVTLYGGLLVAYVAIPLACTTVTLFLTHGVSALLAGWAAPSAPRRWQWAGIAGGPPFMILIWVAGVSLQIGLMGIDYVDSAREVLARYGAMLGISIALWLTVFGVSVFGPYALLALMLLYLPGAVAGFVTWIGAGVTGWITGQSAKTNGSSDSPVADKKTAALDVLGRYGSVIFLVGFLVVVSLGVHVALQKLVPRQGTAASSPGAPAPGVELSGSATFNTPGGSTAVVELHGSTSLSPKPIPAWLTRVKQTKDVYADVLGAPKTPPVAFGLLLGCLTLVLVCSWRFNINEFSMHHFYKNRLVRCYLGASRGRFRHAHRMTGFDPDDDFPLSSLCASRRYCGPYPIVNCTLNVNTGSELSTAERKALSFVFTPLFSGFQPPESRRDDAERRVSRDLRRDGYCETAQFMEPGKGPRLGTTVAISGAALSPNAGYHTSRPLAFLLTMLTVRLGWWVGNPRRRGPSSRPGPRNALVWLLAELFAQTNHRSAYLNLSDGGHFDNLGLYELIRRRSRYIVVCDAEEDPDYTFDALGCAIRKCRADFGVEITIDPTPIRRAANGFSRVHCVVGEILYPEIETGIAEPLYEDVRKGGSIRTTEDPNTSTRAKGWLVYWKASMTGDEPEDVRQYHDVSSARFPHESTQDQFFGESQFESYRQLGLHIVRKTFDNVPMTLDSDVYDAEKLLTLFQTLYRRGYPAPEDIKSNFTERYSALMRRLESPSLAQIGSQFFGGLPWAPENSTAQAKREVFHFCLDLIQLMEDIYFELGFDGKVNRENPQYAGWMSVFGTWVQSPAVWNTWCIASTTFNLQFQEFFEALRKSSSKEAPTALTMDS